MSPKPLGLELNRNARISIQDHDETPSFLVEAPVKGASWSCVRVCAENLPGAHSFLCSILIDGRRDTQIGEQDAAELVRIGLFAPVDAMPQAVAYQFPLRGTEDSGASISRSEMGEIGGQAERALALGLPAEWSEQTLRFEPHHHGSVWAPAQVAVGAEPGDGRIAERSLVLEPETSLDGDATRTQFEREGFARLENLLPAEHVKELGRYFHALAEQGFLHCINDRGMLRYIAHNHPVASFWHEQLNNRVSQLAGRRTKPSYSYVSLYIAGGDLFWHTDRPPCEYTITLLLDYAPLDANNRSPWALKLKGRDGTDHALYQRAGEALILRGRELMHGRDVLPDGHRSASLLFHFVNEDYAGVME